MPLHQLSGGHQHFQVESLKRDPPGRLGLFVLQVVTGKPGRESIGLFAVDLPVKFFSCAE
jgi:hypothetical protein